MPKNSPPSPARPARPESLHWDFRSVAVSLGAILDPNTTYGEKRYELLGAFSWHAHALGHRFWFTQLELLEDEKPLTPKATEALKALHAQALKAEAHP